MTLTDHRSPGKPRGSRHGRWTVNSRFLIGKPGNPMMERWRLIQTPLFGVYVHRIYREDLDPVPHDHPWRFWSVILRGGYTEEYHADTRIIGWGVGRKRVYRRHNRGHAHGFPLQAAHRIVGVSPGTVTLVFVGRKVRSWGFYDSTGRFTDWRDALGLRPTEGSRSTGKYPA